MKINTKIFGEVTIDDDKIILFPNGIIGFPDLQHFTLIHDEEKDTGIHWMQSVEEPAFAMPVMDPLLVKTDYNPSVEESLLECLGTLKADEMVVLVTMTVPSDITKMTVNLRGPIVINAAEKKGCQIILEDDAYPVRFPVYEILAQNKKKAGE